MDDGGGVWLAVYALGREAVGYVLKRRAARRQEQREDAEEDRRDLAALTHRLEKAEERQDRLQAREEAAREAWREACEREQLANERARHLEAELAGCARENLALGVKIDAQDDQLRNMEAELELWRRGKENGDG